MSEENQIAERAVVIKGPLSGKEGEVIGSGKEGIGIKIQGTNIIARVAHGAYELLLTTFSHQSTMENSSSEG